jgi:cytochrome c biogenesis protein CcmG/thiol:disulfide interchange protein DsbE
MNRYVVPIGVFALLVVVLAIGIGRAPEKSIIKSVLLDKPAPQFVLPQLGDAAPFDSRSLQGRWYVLNVWGTWCAECRAEHETLLEIQRSGRVPLVGLNWKDEDALATDWLSQLGNPYSHVALDREGRVAIDWGVYGAPETFLVDAAGVVRYKHVGPMTPEVWQREFLSRLPPAGAAATPGSSLPALPASSPGGAGIAPAGAAS